ncbi:DUF7139 domain-containing protein [Halomicrobium salinisoli]|uniref:DUF7139 domain-containing protein n=1 Tax=Halomicrobium salinisoli TaxID=2878391 RepID=UPI001CF0BC17|nr:hypothetical protein [Halomicrobium salinisoli]
MTSLTDVYEGRVGRVASRRQQLLGGGLFLAGAAAVVAAIAVATTVVGVETMGKYGGRELAGVLAGLGLPAVLLGVFTVLPAGRTARAGAVIGSGVAVLGVALFRHAYPYQWVQADPLFALATAVVYFLGVVTVFWCLFVALATFQTRNDPGGTARMEITREGRIRLVEEARSLGRFGGVGLFGSEPDGTVETQTNREEADDGAASRKPNAEVATANGTGRAADGHAVTDDATVGAGSASTERGGRDDGTEPDDAGWSTSGQSGTGTQSGTGGQFGAGWSTADQSGSGGARQPNPAATADGGSAADDGIVEPTFGPSVGSGDESSDDSSDSGTPDVYCGNCRHFEYVMADGEPAPYCKLHERRMDDMEACSGWVKQSPGDAVDVD